MITPEGLLDLLGLDYIERPGRLQLCCPWHHDTDPSSGFYLDSNRWYCFSCDLTLNIIGFYAKYKEIPYKDAERALLREFGELPPIRQTDFVPMVKVKVESERLLESVQGDFCEKARMEEDLDRLLWLYEQGRIQAEELDISARIWYNSVWEVINETNPYGASRVSLDARLQKGMGHLSRPGSSDGEVDLD